jgi:nucleoid DNA-binding protein
MTPQQELLNEMLRISDGYLKYEFEDFFEILKQAILNKVIKGEAVGITSIVVFKPRVYNSKPRVSNMTGDMIKEGSSTTVKAEVTAMFKRKLKEAQWKAKEDAERKDQGSYQEA